MSAINLLRRIARSSPLLDGVPGTTSARYWFSQATLNDMRHVCQMRESSWTPAAIKPALGTEVIMRGDAERSMICEGFYNDFSHIKASTPEGFYLIIPGVGAERVEWVTEWIPMPKSTQSPPSP